jgi:hypothetical protein
MTVMPSYLAPSLLAFISFIVDVNSATFCFNSAICASLPLLRVIDLRLLNLLLEALLVAVLNADLEVVARRFLHLRLDDRRQEAVGGVDMAKVEHARDELVRCSVLLLELLVRVPE